MKIQRNRREFIPVSRFVGRTTVVTTIKRYFWTRSRGLYVEFKDGLKVKSDYTLPELLASGEVTEVSPSRACERFEECE